MNNKTTLQEIKEIFEVIGFSKDYYVEGKLIGSETLKEQDRETFGYMGRRKELVNQEIRFKSKRILAGTEVVTELNVLCGKSKVDFIKQNIKE